MRVYLASTLPLLARARAGASFGPEPLRAFAVTSALREWYRDDDLEALEYAASQEAARESLRRLAADPDAADPTDPDPADPDPADPDAADLLSRRVVVAVDVPDGVVRPDPGYGPGAVLVGAEVEWARVASVHVDEPAAAAAVRAAARALPIAESGDPDASFVVDEASAYELAWYARQEVPDLLGAAGEPGDRIPRPD